MDNEISLKTIKLNNKLLIKGSSIPKNINFYKSYNINPDFYYNIYIKENTKMKENISKLHNNILIDIDCEISNLQLKYSNAGIPIIYLNLKDINEMEIW